MTNQNEATNLPNYAYRMRPMFNGKGEGQWAYMIRVEEVAEMLEEGDTHPNDNPHGNGYEIQKVTMTQEQFDTLPDFEGW